MRRAWSTLASWARAYWAEVWRPPTDEEIEQNRAI